MLTTNEYYIEKRRTPVRLTFVGGESVEGELFIQASTRGRALLEDAPEFMNSGEAFFPLQMDDGSTRLIARSHVMVARANGEFGGDPWETFGRPVTVAVRMADASLHHGRLMLERVSPHPRVLDWLNHDSAAFMALYGDDDVTLLNRSHVVYVQPFEDGTA